ncbi:MAG: hypothetical protein RL607_2468 [Bacteroidota bacterium]|jgi:nucleoside-diphosphate-sugar epimerase
MILVTGGTGLVGAHLLLHLIENGENNLKAIYRNSQQIEKTKSLFEYYQKIELFPTIQWIQGDILDIPSLEIAFQKVTKVYHCAAQISFDPNDEDRLRKTNIEGTANIVNFCVANSIQKLCHVSSIAALGDLNHTQTLLTEDIEWNPEVLHSDYAISKYGAEMEVWRGQQEGLHCIIVNPGIILGPYPTLWDQTKGSGALLHTIKKGIPFYSHGSTGYVSVLDVVKAMYQLMESDISGERFILIAENRTYKDIIFTISDLLKVSKPKFEVRKWHLELGWRIDALISFLFRTRRRLSRQSANSLLSNSFISNEKIKTALEFEFESIDPYLEKIMDTYK